MIQSTITDLLRRLSIRQSRKGLSVTCSDDYNRNSTVVQKQPYPYMHYYRTEVRNTLDVPLRIVWFDAFHRQGWVWIAGNILGHPLNGKVFSEWYSDGEAILDGIIPPGHVAVCGTNWHGSKAPVLGPIKWVYKAVDPSGLEYYAEVLLERQFMTDVLLRK